MTANSLHPGFVRSNFGRNNGPVVGLVIGALGLVGRAITVEQGRGRRCSPRPTRRWRA